MPRPTTALLAKEYLFALLGGIAGLAGVQVTWGLDTRDLEREFVYVGAITYADTNWAAIGARARDEDYTIEVVVNAQIYGGTEHEAETRVYALGTAIDTAIQAVPNMAGLVTTAILNPRGCVSFPIPEACEAELKMAVQIRARL